MLFYCNLIKLKNRSIRLDLIKSRLSLLNEVKNIIESNDDVDINYHCKLRFKDNDELFFESLDDLKDKLASGRKD